MSGGRAALIVVAIAVAAAASPAAGNPVLRQLHGAGACLSIERPSACDPARGFTNPLDAGDVAMSGDGRSLYLAGENTNAFGVVRVNPQNGRVRQEAGPRGCFAEHAKGPEFKGCASARGLAGNVDGVAVSPDGRSIYVASLGPETLSRQTRNGAVAIFARDGAG